MSDSTFNILSFDGGGIRGALSIKLLEKIQNETPNIVKKSICKWNIDRKFNSSRFSLWDDSK